MDIELVAKQMRDRAIKIELALSGPEARRKSKQLHAPEYKSVDERLEELKKLYFNAGRWAGGARDHIARIAAEQVEALNEDR
jgi:hypothetical protein